MIKPHYQDSKVKILNGHVITELRSLPDEVVHMCCTSPPYWGLRDYGLPPQVWDDSDCQHEWGDELPRAHKTGGNIGVPTEWQRPSRAAQEYKTSGQFCQKCNAWRGSLGLEPDPGLYISHLVQVFKEIKRVLRKDGTVWLNLGDSYASTPCGNPTNVHWQYGDGKQDRGTVSRSTVSGGLKPKDLCGIPWRVALALQASGWWLRSDIIWSKKNPMPESVTDRPTQSHEYVFLLTKSAKYFYDADAVREPLQESTKIRYQTGWAGNEQRGYINGKPQNHLSKYMGSEKAMSATGRNLRSVWTIATQPFKDAHFARFPEKLVEPCIKAGTSEKGCCPECGAPWVRVVEKVRAPDIQRSKNAKRIGMIGRNDNERRLGQELQDWYNENPSKTIGWRPSCECFGVSPEQTVWDVQMGLEEYNPIPCTVLDPFGGSGRTAIVAKKLGRKCIIIELKPEYCDMPLDELRQENIF